MLCFGHAGSTIVSKMINSATAYLNFSQERGRQVKRALFCHCDVRNFTDATEVWEERVVGMVNQVANIVHGETVRGGGEPNKNIGDAFLLVWRLGDEDLLKHKESMRKGTLTQKKSLISNENYQFDGGEKEENIS